MPSHQLDVQKRQHRERGQPLHRKGLGLLEKHKDYIKRARDYHSKQDRLRLLREKAVGRNKDEFYFGMIKSKTQRGVHVQNCGNESLSIDLVKVLKTQDIKYIKSQKASEQKKIQRLRESLESQTEFKDALPNLKPNTVEIKLLPQRHTFFAEDLEPTKGSNSIEALKLSENAKVDIKGKGKSKSEDEEILKSRLTHRTKTLAELRARIKRWEQICRAERELEIQKLLMGRGSKRALVSPKRQVDDEDFGDEVDVPRSKSRRFDQIEEGVTTSARVWKWKAERRR